MGENRRKSSDAEESLGREKDENKNGFKCLRFEAVCAMKAVQKVGVRSRNLNAQYASVYQDSLVLIRLFFAVFYL